MDEGANKAGAFADDKGGWKIGTIWTLAGGIGGFANGAEVGAVGNNVFFTTVAKRASRMAATPTRVGREKVERADNRCIFYMI